MKARVSIDVRPQVRLSKIVFVKVKRGRFRGRSSRLCPSFRESFHCKVNLPNFEEVRGVLEVVGEVERVWERERELEGWNVREEERFWREKERFGVGVECEIEREVLEREREWKRGFGVRERDIELEIGWIVR